MGRDYCTGMLLICLEHLAHFGITLLGFLHFQHSFAVGRVADCYLAVLVVVIPDIGTLYPYALLHACLCAVVDGKLNALGVDIIAVCEEITVTDNAVHCTDTLLTPDILGDNVPLFGCKCPFKSRSNVQRLICGLDKESSASAERVAEDCISLDHCKVTVSLRILNCI